MNGNQFNKILEEFGKAIDKATEDAIAIVKKLQSDEKTANESIRSNAKRFVNAAKDTATTVISGIGSVDTLKTPTEETPSTDEYTKPATYKAQFDQIVKVAPLFTGPTLIDDFYDFIVKNNRYGIYQTTENDANYAEFFTTKKIIGFDIDASVRLGECLHNDGNIYKITIRYSIHMTTSTTEAVKRVLSYENISALFRRVEASIYDVYKTNGSSVESAYQYYLDDYNDEITASDEEGTHHAITFSMLPYQENSTGTSILFKFIFMLIRSAMNEAAHMYEELLSDAPIYKLDSASNFVLRSRVMKALRNTRNPSSVRHQFESLTHKMDLVDGFIKEWIKTENITNDIKQDLYALHDPDAVREKYIHIDNGEHATLINDTIDDWLTENPQFKDPEPDDTCTKITDNPPNEEESTDTEDSANTATIQKPHNINDVIESISYYTGIHTKELPSQVKEFIDFISTCKEKQCEECTDEERYILTNRVCVEECSGENSPDPNALTKVRKEYNFLCQSYPIFKYMTSLTAEDITYMTQYFLNNFTADEPKGGIHGDAARETIFRSPVRCRDFCMYIDMDGLYAEKQLNTNDSSRIRIKIEVDTPRTYEKISDSQFIHDVRKVFHDACCEMRKSGKGFVDTLVIDNESFDSLADCGNRFYTGIFNIKMNCDAVILGLDEIVSCVSQIYEVIIRLFIGLKKHFETIPTWNPGNKD